MILLVEDNPDERELARRAFARAALDKRLVICECGQSALDFLRGEAAFAGRNLRQMPAVVLLDLKMPRMDGIEVLRRLRADERTALLPVVMLTSSIEERDMIECYRLGANSFVHKPLSFKQFAILAEQIESYWLQTNVMPSANAA